MATVTIDVSELPAAVADAVTRAAAGDEVIVTVGGKPTAKLVPVQAEKPRREWAFNLHPGAMIMAPNFNDPIDEDDFLRGDL